MILRAAYLQFTFAFSERTLLGTVEYPEDVQYVNSGGRRGFPTCSLTVQDFEDPKLHHLKISLLGTNVSIPYQPAPWKEDDFSWNGQVGYMLFPLRVIHYQLDLYICQILFIQL